MLVERTGNIFETKATAIGHGCNCRARMSAGIAAEIRKRYPEAFEQYRRACAEGAFRPGAVQLVRTQPHWILNMATQEDYGVPMWRGGCVWARLEWSDLCLRNVIELAAENGILAVAFSRVGCDKGGLFWDATDYELKRHRYDAAAGTMPVEEELVKGVFVRTFSRSELAVEVWNRPP